MILTTGLAACGADKTDAVATGNASSAAAPADPTTAAAPADPTTAAAEATTVTKATPVDDGCPADVNLMYERLKATPAIRDEIDASLSGLQQPVCADRWAVSRTVVKNADSTLVLFKYSPDHGWTPVAVGSDGVCEGKVPAATKKKLGTGC